MKYGYILCRQIHNKQERGFKITNHAKYRILRNIINSILHTGEHTPKKPGEIKLHGTCTEIRSQERNHLQSAKIDQI